MIMRSGRFVFLPFSIRCDSESSVAIAAVSSTTKQPNSGEKGGEEKLKMDKDDGSVSTKASIFTQGFNRLMRRFKTFSHFFVYKEEMEYVEKELEIGYPTDVRHVTHIGSDGSTTVNPVSSWANNLKPSEILSFPSISLQKLEIAMSAQSAHS